MADTYTHKDLAALCGVSETTIKSYRRKFPGFIPVLTRGKPIRFKSEAGDVCLKIRDCFAKGMSVNETHKVLKQHFKEDPPARSRRAAAPPRPAEPSSGISEEYLEKFFATAGQMMQGMAGLATAQAKAERRLQKVENVLSQLLELEARNNETFGRLLEQQEPARPVEEPVAPKADAESRVRSRKIVNVRGPEGEVKSYTLQTDEAEATPEQTPEQPQEQTAEPQASEPSTEVPSDAFLNTPIVIRNDQGEFLGVPGRLPVAGFLDILLREARENGTPHSTWEKRGTIWVFTTQAVNGDKHDLYFTSTTTPRGNLVVLLDRLDHNGKETSSQFLQEFFRQVKDKV